MNLQLQSVTTQKILLSQVMWQSLNILECSTEELQAFLQDKQEKNPFLKIRYRNNETWEFANDIKDSSYDFSQDIQEQLLHIDISERLMKIIKLVIADLSETGFLTQTPNEMSLCFKAAVKEINEALELLRNCKPEGLGCANLQEFLIRQSEEMPEKITDILTNYYDLFLHQQWKELSKHSSYSLEDIKEASVYISRMKTRPLDGNGRKVIFVRPDVTISVTENQPTIKFHEHAFPKTFFDYEYEGEPEESVEVKKYLKDQYKEVETIKEQLALRKETLRKIVEKLVIIQEEFLRKGPKYLKTMTMTNLARQLDLHVSTVSRAVREKYILTPYGTFPMRYFFSSCNKFLDETKMTVNQLKGFVFDTIQSEDKSKPVSDQEIVNILKRGGVKVSRRVIAKYRQELNLPASIKRKAYC